MANASTLFKPTEEATHIFLSAFHSLQQKMLCCGLTTPPQCDHFETAFHFLLYACVHMLV